MCLGVRRLEIECQKIPENKGKTKIANFHILKYAVKRRLFLFWQNSRVLCSR